MHISKTAVFLAVAFGWVIVVSAGMAAFGIKPSSPLGIGLLALLYMPSPTIAAFVVERRLVRERLRLPSAHDGRRVLTFFLLPAAAVAGALVIFFAVTAVLGNLFHINGVGILVTSVAQLKRNVAQQHGSGFANSANYPPSIAVMVVVTFVAALVAGWSINGLFALGEEYGWRGFLWERWRHLGAIRANLAIGVVWGLWHAPVILQGYNYPGHPIAGVFLMAIFTTSLAFVLSAIRELTGSVLPAAATHGSINGAAALTILLTSGANPLIGELVGLAGCFSLLVVGALFWWFVAGHSPLSRGPEGLSS